jgi:MFS family permease
MRDVYHRAPLAAVGAFVAGVLLGAFYALGAVYARRIGLDAAGAARWMGAGILGGLLLQWPLGRLSDRVGRRPVIAGASLLLVGAGAALGWGVEAAGTAAVLLVIVYGAATAVLYPLSLAYGSDRFDDGERTSACGSLVVLSALGSVAGPLLASSCMRLLGPGGLFLMGAAVAAAVAAYTLRRVLVRPAVPADEREEFVFLPRTTPSVADIDPRGAAGLRS